MSTARRPGLVLVFLALGGALSTARAQADAEQEGCVVCHGLEGRQWQHGVHADSDVTCTSCHGGDPVALDGVEAHGNGFQSLKGPMESVMLCGGCHSDPERMRVYGLRTDQLALYWTSQHGTRLKEDGDARVATCVSCHGAHGVLPLSDPRSSAHKLNQVETCGRCHADPALMEPFGLSAEAPEQFRQSVHGRALLEQGHLASPGCADCHGSHGAKPPRVDEVEKVCGACHTVVKEYFDRSVHLPASQAGKMNECVACHGNHGVQEPSAAMLTGRQEGHCGSCHEEQSGSAAQLGENMYQMLRGLDARIQDATRSVQEAGKRGLFIEREHGYLDEARGLRVKARPLTHATSPDLLADLMNRADAMVAETFDSLGIKERILRDRKIFTGIFLAMMVVFSVVLLLFRRRVGGGFQEPWRLSSSPVSPAQSDPAGEGDEP